MKFFHSYLMALSLVLGLISSCSAQSQHTVDAARFKAKVEANVGNVTLLDVRTAKEFADGSIPNAINIDVNAADFQEKVAKLDKNKNVFVYCLSGARSATAGEMMRKMGFGEVYELQGGIMAWRKNGFATAAAAGTAAKVEMTREEFTALLQGAPNVLIDFYAPWCGPCKQMEPMLEELSKTEAGRLKIVRINVDDNPTLASEMGAEKIPYFMLFKGDKMTWTHAGMLTRDGILQQIAQ